MKRMKNSEAEIKQVEVNEERWKEFIKSARSQAVRNITFGVPMKSREAGGVVKATSRIYAKAMAMQLPITRVHTDRAREFAGSRFQKWLADRNVYHTMCAGDEPQSNARAEREVQTIKSSMRAQLLAAGAPDHFWPLAMRQSIELRQRSQLKSLGIVLPELLPFGSKAIVKRKTWHNRAEPLRWPMMKVRLWGPAQDMAASSRGYFVQGEDGKFFRSTVVKIPDVMAQTGDLRPEEQQEQGNEFEDPEPGSLPGGEERSEEQEEREQQQGQPDEEQQQDIVEDLSLELDQGETPCPCDRWCVDPREGIKEGSNGKDKGLEGLFNMNMGVELEEITDRELLMIQSKMPSKRRYHGKCPPRIEQGQEAIVRKIALKEEWRNLVETEEMEQVLVKQLFALEKWIKCVAESVTEGVATTEEVKLAVRAKEETAAMEQLIREFNLRKMQAVQEDQQVLQTKAIGMDEVRRDLEAWIPVFAEEVKSLAAEALEPINEEQFQEILRGGQEVECLPMKAIATVKPPNRKKGRVVVCGNYAAQKQQEEELLNSAGGRFGGDKNSSQLGNTSIVDGSVY